MNLTKLFALFGATILLSNYLPAQDDVDIEDADEVEEVVVTGIKRSLLDAIDIKTKMYCHSFKISLKGKYINFIKIAIK